MKVIVDQLIIYPIKSLRGISLDSAVLTPAGLKGDREWMIIDEKGGFATQRKHPLMATISTSICDNKLILTAQDGDSISLTAPQDQDAIEVNLWKDRVQANRAKNIESQWITDKVQSTKPLFLVHFDKNQKRAIDTERFGEGYTFFADGAPYLVTNTSSIDALNQALNANDQPIVNMDRFRANIVISGIPAFLEHTIKQLCSADGNTVIALKDHCQRCSVITVDQDTGIRSANAHPFKALAALNAMPENQKAPAFGVNSVMVSGENKLIKIGDTFTAAL